MGTKICKSLSELPDPGQLPRVLTFDVETTSGDSGKKALYPYRGTRIAGIGVGDEEDQWYIPFRHTDVRDNLPYEQVNKWMVEVFKDTGRVYQAQNIKFDLHCLVQDNIEVQGPLQDIMVLARLSKYPLRRLNFIALVQNVLGKAGKEDYQLKAYLKSIKSKNFGDAPASILGKYCCCDVRDEAKLGVVFRENIRTENLERVLPTENALTPILFQAERRGFQVDELGLKKRHAAILRRKLEIWDKLNKITGVEFDPDKDEEVIQVLCYTMGHKPRGFTPTGKVQWNKVTLKDVGTEECLLIDEYHRLSHFASGYTTNDYGKGWRGRICDDGRIHPTFFQAGTRTGRLSAGDPNMQNATVEAETYMLPDSAFCAWDYSQIEYRFFGHYTGDPKIVGAYQDNPKADFHQLLADMLGVNRQFAKALNFSFLYGMGKKKLLHQLQTLLTLNEAPDAAEKLKDYIVARASSDDSVGGDLRLEVLAHAAEAAENIYNGYHGRFPSIRRFQRRVGNVINQRGWIKNLYGRTYDIQSQDWNKGLNYIIQGVSADLLKDRMVAMRPLCDELGADLVVTIHDSVMYDVPRENIEEFYMRGTEILQTPSIELSVPILVDGKIATKSWGQMVAVEKNNVKSALKSADAAKVRRWGGGTD